MSKGYIFDGDGRAVAAFDDIAQARLCLPAMARILRCSLRMNVTGCAFPDPTPRGAESINGVIGGVAAQVLIARP